MLLERGGKRVITYSWYLRAGSLAEEWWRQALALDRSPFEREEHILAIRFSAPIPRGETALREAEDRIRRAWERLAPELAGYAPLVAAFRGLRQRGVELWLLRGNRDVLLEPADLEPFGGRLADRLLAATGSGTLLLSHGDEYCLRDRPYQRLRRALRARPLRWLLRSLPRRLRLGLAARMRGASQAAISRKPLDSMALVEEAVEAALADQGAAGAVIGHLHRAEQRVLAGGGALRVLPAWTPEQPPEPI